MKIFINGRFLTQKITGVQRFGIEVVKELDKFVKTGEVEILTPPGIINEISLNNIKITTIGKKSNNYWVQITLPLYVKKHKGELLTMAGMCPVFCPGFFLAHDTSFVRLAKTYSKAFAISYATNFALTLNRCKKVFTISNFAKKEIMDVFNVKENKIVLVSPSSLHLKNRQYNLIPVEKWGVCNQDYYLSVSSQTIHKNQKYIVECAKKYPEKVFVIAGGKPNTFAEVKNDEVENLIYTGYVTDDELFSLYKQAKGFIFPSLYEGFGLPPLEALTMGVRSIAVSDIEVFREVYCRNVYFFNPNDVNDFNIKEWENFTITDEDLLYYENKHSWQKTATIIYNTIIQN